MSDRFLDELRVEVLAAARREDERRRRQADRRRRRNQLLASAAVVLAVVAGVVVFVQPEQAQADVVVIREGDDILVRLTDVESRPDEIEDAAADAGLDVTVTEVPVGPSNVGRFVGATIDGAFPEELTVEDGDPNSAFNGFRVPVGYPGRIDLRLGRPAGDDESWAVSSDATSKGEVLECLDLVGQTLGDVLREVDRAGIENVRVLVPDGPGEVARAQFDQWADTTVVAVTTQSGSDVFIDAVVQVGSVPEQPARTGC